MPGILSCHTQPRRRGQTYHDAPSHAVVTNTLRAWRDRWWCWRWLLLVVVRARYMNVRGRNEDQRAAHRREMAASLGVEKREREEKIDMCVGQWQARVGVGAWGVGLAAIMRVQQAPARVRACCCERRGCRTRLPCRHCQSSASGCAAAGVA